ncbi:MAG: transglycosylase domain-containing protein [Pseudomonadota bacterium]|nr:transglycosylase domain-containing protein [Pseudomonadota bacterium]
MKALLPRLRQLAASLPGHLRHPTRRGIAWALAAVPLVVLLYTLILIPFTPSIADLRKEKTAKPSVVLSADGKELAVFKRANREWVKLADISPNVVAALIATEDHRFYEHHGMDFKRTASALLHTFGGDLQGGSTLTQQLARNLYPEEIGRAASITRKLKEAITAVKIESVYTKDEILETYLNTVPFLYNAFGIEMAARTYFDKSARKLDVLESATLVGMLKGTSYYNPVQNPERSLQRRNTVLGQMVKRGKLKEATFATLKKRPLRIDFERQSEDTGPAPHLAQQLRRWLIEWADRNDYNIYADGLVLRTTIDARLQAMANNAVARHASGLQRLASAQWGTRSVWAAKGGPMKALVQSFVRASPEYKAALEAGQAPEEALAQLQANAPFMQALQEGKTRLQAGFLALDPRNGHVMAWVGSRSFAQDPFDHVEQARRQPGSTFKPFVYGAAFENGTQPSDSFVDQAVEIPLGNGAFWRPSDGGGPSGLPMTLREGLMYSKNTITAQVMQQVGPEHVARLARAMGVRQSKLDEVLSLALGTSPVTLKEMVTSYATLANEGNYIAPVMILQVENRDGGVLEMIAPKPPEAALPVAAAHTLLDVMRGVIDQGTGTAIRSRYGIRADVAGKTGTTQDNTDGWFLLMHPQLVAGAWVGFNDNRITMGDGWGPGARSALPMVGDFFQHALRARVVDQKARFAAPQGVGGFEGSGAPDPMEPLLGQGADALNGEPLAEPQPDSELSPEGALPGPADAGVEVQAPPGEVPLAPVIRQLPTLQTPESDLQVPADLQGPNLQRFRRLDIPEPQR